ncbi:hypothetical protein [Streptomyces fradiae]|uniref:hypothetical protein n=1 Tax=Streptomyces fradiae TaxID=1906 RepID=UPI0036FCA8F1
MKQDRTPSTTPAVTAVLSEALRRGASIEPVTEPLSLTAAAALERLEWAFAPRGPITPTVLRLRTAMRAARYNPDLPHQVEAFATIATIDTPYLRALLTGRAPLDRRLPRHRVAQALGIKAVA